MRFEYAYRDASGAKLSGEIDAADRADCFAKLKARGIVPMRVEAVGKAGRNASGISHTEARRHGGGGGKTHAEAKRRRGGGDKWVWVIALLLAALIGGGVWWLVHTEARPDMPPEPSTKKVALAKEVKPAAAPKPVAVANAPSKVEADAPSTPWTNIYTNGRGEEVRVERDGKKVLMLKAWQEKREAEAKNPPKRVFRHAAEAYMAMFLNPAVAVPPPPENFTNDQVAQMLVNKIEIDPEKDTEDEIRQKEGVQKMKEELKGWLKDGGTFDSYLNELQRRQNLEAEKMFEARKMISEAMEKGDVEEARELYDAINKHFDEQGMPHVNVAPKYRKMLNQPKTEQK